jgi:hypothetical protein
MSEETQKHVPENMPQEITKIDKSKKQLYIDLLSFLDSHEEDGGAILAFTLADGSHCFSFADPLDVLLKISVESIFSDRLWVVISVAYLEDQIRLLLEKFLTDDEVSRDLLDPNRSSIGSLMPMANMAFSLGLLAKEWYEILKRMAQLRNKFAHIPSARNFEDLVNLDPKNLGLIDSLIHRYKQFPGSNIETPDDFRKIYRSLFLLMYELIQFSIDHIAGIDKRQKLHSDQIIEINNFNGFDKDNLRDLLSTHF